MHWCIEETRAAVGILVALRLAWWRVKVMWACRHERQPKKEGTT